jgi:hypothetical protein
MTKSRYPIKLTKIIEGEFLCIEKPNKHLDQRIKTANALN